MVKNFKFKFIITLILVMLSMSLLMPFASLAIDTSYLKPDQFDDSSYDNAKNFKLSMNQQSNTAPTFGGVITKFLSVILTLVRTVAVGWAILMAISIAIKYMSGDAQIKSQIKTDMPTYVIGAALLFGAAGLITLAQYFVEDVIVV